MNIGILYICTGRYSIFWKEFYESCEKYFLPEDTKYYYVFTDADSIEYENQNRHINKIFQENLGWPDNTLKRFHIFLNSESLYENMDYLFFFNANLEILREIDRGFLPSNNNLLVVKHPGYYNKTNDVYEYDRNSESTAYVEFGKGEVYVAGGLNGGPTQLYLEMLHILKQNIDIDLQHGYIARWHDESHINAFIINHTNYKALSPDYLYPEETELPFEPIILIRDKKRYGGHGFLRSGDIGAFCEKYKEVFIYGVGIKGLEAEKILINKGIKKTSFVISDGQDKRNKEDVIFLSELSSSPQETGIIIAVPNEVEGEIKMKCQQKGYNNLYLYYR